MLRQVHDLLEKEVDIIRERERKIHEKVHLRIIEDYLDKEFGTGGTVEQIFTAHIEGKKIERGFRVMQADGTYAPEQVVLSRSLFDMLSADQQKQLVENFNNVKSLKDIGVSVHEILKITKAEQK